MALDDISSFRYWAVLYSGVPFSPDYTHSFYMPPINENNNQLDTFLAKYQINSAAIRGVGFRPNFDPAIKKRNTIRFMGDYKTFAQANYMMVEHEYKDETNYNFFCFIHQINILNNSVLEVEYEVDVLATYLPYLTIGKCYIVRETSNDDELYSNVHPEELQVKSYVMSDRYEMFAARDFNSYPGAPEGGPWYVVPYQPTQGSYYMTLINGMSCPYEYESFDYNTEILGDMRTFLNNTLSEQQSASIPGIYLMPMVPKSSILNPSWAQIDVQLMSDFAISRATVNTEKGPYFVKNKKLLSSPFCYCRLWSTLGEEVILEPQLCGTNLMTFNIFGSFNGSGWELSCVPRYGGNTNAYTKRVNWSATIMTPFSSNTYDQWLANQGIANTMSMGMSALMLAGGVAATVTGVGAGLGFPSIVGGLAGLTNSYSQNLQASKAPDNGFTSRTYGNVLNLMLEGQCGFEWQYFVPSWDDCERIDSFFDSFGYACGEYREPVIHGNPEGNYIQATNMELYGPAPGYAMQRIREIFARGVTFHDGNYLNSLV